MIYFCVIRVISHHRRTESACRFSDRAGNCAESSDVGPKSNDTVPEIRATRAASSKDLAPGCDKNDLCLDLDEHKKRRLHEDQEASMGFHKRSTWLDAVRLASIIKSDVLFDCIGHPTTSSS